MGALLGVGSVVVGALFLVFSRRLAHASAEVSQSFWGDGIEVSEGQQFVVNILVGVLAVGFGLFKVFGG